jgi:hypothetical protein
MSLKIVFLSVTREGAAELVPPRMLNDAGYSFPRVTSHPTTAALIVRRLCTAEDSFGQILEGKGRGGAIAAMSRIMGTTTKNWISEKPRSRVRSALGRSGCAVVLMAEIHSWRWRKKKGGSAASSLVPKLAWELVADRTGSWESVRNCGASSRTCSDRSTRTEKLD